MSEAVGSKAVGSESVRSGGAGSDAAGPALRVRPARPHRLHKTPWPWHDRSGRFSPLKSAVLAVELAPGLWLAYALWAHLLGARPIHEALHQTGFWAVRFLLLGLLVSPLRSIFNWHRIVLVRRQLGLTALAYALAHLALYAWDENWAWLHVAAEILERFYLEVGLVALVGLGVLGASSTDHALRQLGHGWKRLHRLIYPVAALALFHYFLQSKADAAGAVLMAGLFVLLMGWRLMPSGADRAPLPVLGLAAAAAGGTAVLEAAWYGLGTNIGPKRPLLAELHVAYGPQPAGQVLLVGVCLAMLTGLFWAQHRERWRRSFAFHMALYGGGALVAVLLSFAFSLADDWLPPDWSFWPASGWFVAAVAACGLLRWALTQHAASARWLLDAVCLVVVAMPVAAGLVF